MKKGTFGHLNQDDELRSIFPDGLIPIKSLVPIIPRNEQSPPCYVMDGNEVSEIQRQQLATQLHQRWAEECKSVHQAYEYILNPGLPLRVDRFSSVSTTNIGLILSIDSEEGDF